MTLEPELLRRHVQLFNQGVRTGDFAPMMESFTEDADLVFEGVPVGPFEGKAAIAEAYRTQPPNDQLDVLDVTESGGLIVASYAWRAEPTKQAGRMTITPRGAKISRLVVTFDQPPT
jgi:ketosteroid isomerase-like protein